MCCRYYVQSTETADEMQEIIEKLNRKQIPFKTGEIFPSDPAPVIANSRSMLPVPYVMRWGYTMPDGKRIINARSESAAEKPLFRDGMLQRRCVIPACHYFEWEHAGKRKTKYAIRSSASGLIWLAGIYRFEQTGPVFSVLTREPAESIAFIHDRMPLIFDHDAAAAWLDMKQDLQEVMRYAVTQLQFTPVEGVQGTVRSLLDGLL